MEDDEETQSHTPHEPFDKPIDLFSMHKREQSKESLPSGGVTVTVAAAPPSSAATGTVNPSSITPPAAPLTLALPIQQYSSSSNARPTTTSVFNGGAVGVMGGGREDCWSERATSVLIDAWGERYMELSRGNLKQKHWKEVADIVNNSGEDHGKTPKTDIQCKNRIDTVKKKYKMEKSKVVGGCGPSRWVFFERMDRLIGPSAISSAVKVSVSPVNGHDAAVPVGIPFGVRQQSMPLVIQPPMSYQTPPHYRPPSQQQSITRNFPTPTPLQQRFNHPSMSNMNNNNNFSYGGSLGSSSSSGRNQVMHQQQQQFHQQQQLHQQQQQFRRAPPVESESEEDEVSNESGDSLPPTRSTEYERRERGRNVSGGVRKGKKGKKGVKVWGNSVRELTRAILKFGEAYETAESAKLEHIVEMEKQRMKFAKELELQRMKFLMKTQLELSQFNGGSGNGNGSGNSGGSSGRSGGSGGVGGGLDSNHLH